MVKYWTHEEELLAMKLRGEGMLCKQIGEIMNRSSGAVAGKLEAIRQYGYKKPRPEKDPEDMRIKAESIRIKKNAYRKQWENPKKMKISNNGHYPDNTTPFGRAQMKLGNRLRYDRRNGYLMDGKPVTVQRILREAEI